MFRFKTEQKVCEVGGVKFGGQPGDYPTIVVPSIFQKGLIATSDQRNDSGTVRTRHSLTEVDFAWWPIMQASEKKNVPLCT